MPSSREPTDRELQRLVLQLVGAVIAVVLAAGIAITVTREERSATPTGGVGAAGEQANAIGPLDRADLAAYIAERSAVLDGLAGNRAAVVSFTRYLREDEVRALVEAEVLLVAGPGGDPSTLSGSLETWAEQQRKQANEEVANLEALLETTDQADFADTYREDIDRYRHLAGALDPKGALVYAAVVIASADELRALAGSDPVRLVDVGPSEQPPPEGAVRGLRPEETARAGEPPYRPVM